MAMVGTTDASVTDQVTILSELGCRLISCFLHLVKLSCHHYQRWAAFAEIIRDFVWEHIDITSIYVFFVGSEELHVCLHRDFHLQLFFVEVIIRLRKDVV